MHSFVPVGNICLASLLAELGNMELWQPYLCQATGFGNL